MAPMESDGTSCAKFSEPQQIMRKSNTLKN